LVIVEGLKGVHTRDRRQQLEICLHHVEALVVPGSILAVVAALHCQLLVSAGAYDIGAHVALDLVNVLGAVIVF